MESIHPVLPNSGQFRESLLAANQPQYKPLVVANITYSDGTQSMISCYKLTLRERVKLLLSGKVWWEQLTFGGPLQPQKMYLVEPFSKDDR